MKRQLLAGFVALGAAACSTVAPNTVPKCNFRAYEKTDALTGPTFVHQSPGSISDMPLDTVIYTDRRIRRKVVVQQVQAQRTPTSTVQVTARFFNCTRKPLTLAARTAFLDSAQGPTEPGSAWKRVFMQPGTMGVYRETSIGQDDVANFSIEIRPAE